MGEYEVALRKYIENILQPGKLYSAETARKWVFGAINFAYAAEMISMDVYNELTEKYAFIK